MVRASCSGKRFHKYFEISNSLSDNDRARSDGRGVGGDKDIERARKWVCAAFSATACARPGVTRSLSSPKVVRWANEGAGLNFELLTSRREILSVTRLAPLPSALTYLPVGKSERQAKKVGLPILGS